MKGLLLDENLPPELVLTAALPVIHATQIAASPTDSLLWQYAKENSLL